MVQIKLCSLSIKTHFCHKPSFMWTSVLKSHTVVGNLLAARRGIALVAPFIIVSLMMTIQGKDRKPMKGNLATFTLCQCTLPMLHRFHIHLISEGTFTICKNRVLR